MARAIGATAISRVIRSDSMRSQHLVEVEPPVQPHRGPGRDRGQQIEQAEDVRGRRGHLEPVVGPEPEDRAPVHRGVAHRPVGVPDRLGQPGRARAEHQDGLVVVAHPVGRRRAPATADEGVRRRVVEIRHAVGPEQPGQQRHGVAVGHGVDRSGQRRARGATSAAFHAGLRRTAAAPILLMALTATMNSARLDVIRATRSPAAHASGGEVPGEGVAALVEVPEGPAVVAGQHGVAIPEPVAARSRCIVHQGRCHRKHSSLI